MLSRFDVGGFNDIGTEHLLSGGERGCVFQQLKTRFFQTK